MHGAIRFNEPSLTGGEIDHLSAALRGERGFAARCQTLLRQRLGCEELLLTTSCSAALEMSAILLELDPGDEVVMPSFTYVSTASAFVRSGARPVFVDIRADTLNLDEA